MADQLGLPANGRATLDFQPMAESLMTKILKLYHIWNRYGKETTSRYTGR